MPRRFQPSLDARDEARHNLSLRRAEEVDGAHLAKLPGQARELCLDLALRGLIELLISSRESLLDPTSLGSDFVVVGLARRVEQCFDLFVQQAVDEDRLTDRRLPSSLHDLL